MKSASARRAALVHDARRARQLYQATLPLVSFADIQGAVRALARALTRIVGNTFAIRPADDKRLDHATHLAVTRTGLALDRSERRLGFAVHVQEARDVAIQRGRDQRGPLRVEPLQPLVVLLRRARGGDEVAR